MRGRTVALLLALAACGKRGSLYSEALAPLPLLSTSSALVQVVPQTRRAVVITPGESTPRGLVISRGARLAVRAPATDLVAILAGTAKEPKLDLVDVGTGKVTTLDLPGPFDAITFSPDARWGVLSYLASSGTGLLTARNLNELALLDVRQPAVTRIALDTDSLAPRGVTYGPAEPNRQLVAVSLERGVALFDALRPTVAPRRISLRAQGSTAETSVLEAVFSSDARWLFLRASALDDVIAVELGTEVGSPVSASLNFVAGGRGLADIEQAPEGFADAVLATYSGSREAFLLDARGIQDNGRRLALTSPTTRLQRLSGARVLLWSEGGQTVTAWDVGDGRSGTAALDGTMSVPMLLPSLDKALLPLANSATGAALTTLSVGQETNRLRLRLQGIQLGRPFAHGALDNGRLFFSVDEGATVVSMELATLSLTEVALDAEVRGLYHVPNGDWLFAAHGTSLLGDVTLLNAQELSRSTAVRYTDFAFTDDLDLAGDPP